MIIIYTSLCFILTYLSPLCVCVCVCVCARALSHFSHVQLLAILWTVAHQAPLSTGFSWQEYWSGLPCPPPGDLLNPRRELASISPALQVDSSPLTHQGSPLLPLYVSQIFSTTMNAKKKKKKVWTLFWRHHVDSGMFWGFHSDMTRAKRHKYKSDINMHCIV